MEIVIIVVVMLVAVGVGGYFMLGRGKDKALPPVPEKKKLPATQDEPETATKAKPKAEALEQLAPAAQVGPDAPTPSEPVPEAELDPPADAPLRRPDNASEEDIAALKKGLKSTRGGFIARLAKLFVAKKEIDPGLIDEIEEVLISADIGVPTTQRILARLRERLEKNELGDADRVWEAIREEASDILSGSQGSLTFGASPAVILVVGVNGVGKTTTIGKLASRYTEEGKKVILAAGDTFRAAAVLQLEVWGRRTKCQVVRGKERADPGSVIFDAIKTARDEGADIVIADTAGRLHTKAPLMEELKKVHRSCGKALEGREADEVLLVLDSTNGQNALEQARMFRDALPVSGIALTKLDGTAKGGVILGIVDEHRVPVRFIGIGERVEDLHEFDAASFVAALFEKPDDETLAA